MIDTIILRIHNIDKHFNIIKGLDTLDTKGYSTEIASVGVLEFRKLRKQGIKNQMHQLEILRMNENNQFIAKTKVFKHLNSSNHYFLSYFVNYTKDFIEINFSIPKYLYGSNVLMFVEHFMDKEYTLATCGDIEYNIGKSFSLLRPFLKNFFKMEFLLVDVDFRDVEVFRIDVCFNQLFKSKDEAIKYLEYQKLKRKKYSRNDEDGVMRDYATYLMYVTKRYSAKIYHKGAEYTKNDLKEHMKINKQMRKPYFRTDEYQDLADKTLRYELTIRNPLLNYLHKRHLFRAKCPYFQGQIEVYDTVENIKQKNDRISKKIAKLSAGEREAYQKAHPYEKVDSDAKKIHKYISRLITKRTKFMLEIDEESNLYNRMTTGIVNCDTALFSDRLLKLCLKKLQEFMDEFQVKELPPINRVEKLIDHYNSEHYKKLPKAEMLGFYKDLCTIGSFTSVGKMNYLSRATLFRYKERFRKIGITESNLIPLTEDGLPQAPLDLHAYHYEMTTKVRFLQKRWFQPII